jgi:protein gp37
MVVPTWRFSHRFRRLDYHALGLTSYLRRGFQAFANCDYFGSQTLEFGEVCGLGADVHAHAEKLSPFPRACHTGDNHYVNMMQDRFLLNCTQDFQAVVFGKMQVQHNHARQRIVTVLTLVLDELESAFAIRGNLYVNWVSLVFQRATQ